MDIAVVSNDRHRKAVTIGELFKEFSTRRINAGLVVPNDTSVLVRDSEILVLYERQRPIRPKVVLNALGSASNRGLSIVQCFEALGTPVINTAEAWRRARIKALTSISFCRNNIPHPDTLFSIGWSDELTSFALRELGAPAVLKPWRGAKGMGVNYCASNRQLESSLAQKTGGRERRDPYVYLQQFVHNPGRHIRAVVLGGEFVGAIYRIHASGQVITNQLEGFGEPRACPATEEVVSLACRAARVLGLDLAGVDLIENRVGLMVIEVNGWPSGYADFAAVTGISIPARIAEFARGQVRV